MYKALFALGYYGLLRVGELTKSLHTIKACDVHLGMNKDKILIILYSSKTHSIGDRPQKVKITSNKEEKLEHYIQRNFCSCKLVSDYLQVRGGYKSYTEAFFIFQDGTSVGADPARKLLRMCIDKIGLDSTLYDMHSFRIGQASDLIKYNYTIEEVKRLGRWKSNVVFKYIRN